MLCNFLRKFVFLPSKFDIYAVILCLCCISVSILPMYGVECTVIVTFHSYADCVRVSLVCYGKTGALLFHKSAK